MSDKKLKLTPDIFTKKFRAGLFMRVLSVELYKPRMSDAEVLNGLGRFENHAAVPTFPGKCLG